MNCNQTFSHNKFQYFTDETPRLLSVEIFDRTKY